MDPCSGRGRDPSGGRGQGTRTGRPPTASGLPPSQAVVPEVQPVEAPPLVRAGRGRGALAVLVTELEAARAVVRCRGAGALVDLAPVDVLGRRVEVGAAGGEGGQDDGRDRTGGDAPADGMGAGVHGVSLSWCRTGWAGRSSTVGPSPQRLTTVDRR